MADASQYPITLNFGSTAYPYSPTSPHHGIDYGAPAWTPIVVSGKTLGFVGATGAALGAHLHVDKNKNFPVDSGYVNPTGWQNIQGKVIFADSAGTAGNMVVVESTDGYYYRFLHMARISVTVNEEVSMDKITKAQEQVLSIMQTGSKPGSNYDYRFTGKPLTQANLDTCLQFWSKQPRPNVKPLPKGIWEVL